jgi:hypothetical protein
MKTGYVGYIVYSYPQPFTMNDDLVQYANYTIGWEFLEM